MSSLFEKQQKCNLGVKLHVLHIGFYANNEEVYKDIHGMGTSAAV